jgi:hypothetical protein
MNSPIFTKGAAHRNGAKYEYSFDVGNWFRCSAPAKKHTLLLLQLFCGSAAIFDLTTHLWQFGSYILFSMYPKTLVIGTIWYGKGLAIKNHQPQTTFTCFETDGIIR